MAFKLRGAKVYIGFVCCMILLMLSSCKKDESLEPPDTSPIVNSYFPTRGFIGDTITIEGQNFDPQSAIKRLAISRIEANIIKFERNEIQAVVPKGVNLGDNSMMLITNGAIIQLTPNFELLDFGIVDFNPKQVSFNEEIQVELNRGDLEGLKLFAFDQEMNWERVDDVTVKFSVPENISNSSSKIEAQFRSYTNVFDISVTLKAPSINDFEPKEGYRAQELIILGDNFSPIVENNKVFFANESVQVLESSKTMLKIVVPRMQQGNHQIKVKVFDQEALSENYFNLLGPWNKVMDFPGGQVSLATAFSNNDNGFVGANSTSTFTTRFWKYTPSNNSWNEVANYPGIGFSYSNMTSFVIGDYAYVGMPSANGSPTGIMKRYSFADNAWTSIASYGGGEIEGGVAMTLNGTGYIYSGFVKAYLHPIGYVYFTTFLTYAYDPSTDIWTQKKNLSPRRRDASSFEISNIGYVLCGREIPNTTLLYNDFYKYDPNLNNWEKLPDFPARSRDKASSFSIGDFGYLVGGSGDVSGDAPLKDFWRYDSKSGVWEKLIDFPGDERYDAVVFVINGKAYYGTGTDGTNKFSDFWEFDPSKI